MPKKKLKISACMMVKNEEELLQGCLESIKNLVDEIIIIDTGSTDDTKKIAGKYTSKIFDSPWRDDFSFHRNESIGKATGDWLIIIDADERLVSNIKKNELKKRLSNIPKNIHAAMITINVKDKYGKTMNHLESVRFIRAGKGEYKNIVHNELIIDGDQSAMPQNYLGITFDHLGYDLSEKKMAEKYARTQKLLKKRIENDPNDYDAVFYLAQSYAADNQDENAINTAKQALEAIPADHNNWSLYGGLYFLIGSKCLKIAEDKPDDEKTILIHGAVDWFEAGLLKFPTDLDLNYARFHLGLLQKNATVCFRNGMNYLVTRNKLRRNPDYLGNRFKLTIGESFENEVKKTLDNIKKKEF